MLLRIGLVILTVALLGVGYDGPPRLSLYRAYSTLTATPLATPAVRTYGRLTWLGGVRLSGSDAAFGGFSALTVRGDRFLALSDGGTLLRFDMRADWRPFAVRAGALPGGPRTGWEKRDRDSEALAFDAAGRAWVGFESVNGIWRYAPGFVRTERSSRPRVMREWATNGGPEAMVRWPDGRFLILAETSRWPGRPGRAGLMFRGDPTVRPRDGFGFSYLPAPGYDPSDAALLPNGDVLVLERRWLPPVRFRTRIALVRRAQLKPGARVAGRELARLGPPFPTENYEGIAVTRDGPATIVWLISDDDQTWWRRTYLVKLRLD